MSQPQGLYRCPTCGASLSLDDLRGTDCKYCKTVFPHHARAVQHAAVVNQVMQQQIHQAQNMGYGYGMPYYGAPAFGAADAAVKGSMIGLFVALGVVVALVLVGAVVALLLFL